MRNTSPGPVPFMVPIVPTGFISLLSPTTIKMFFPVIAASSKAAPFVFFAAMMALQFFVVLFWYPETRNVPLEEMQKKLGIA